MHQISFITNVNGVKSWSQKILQCVDRQRLILISIWTMYEDTTMVFLRRNIIKANFLCVCTVVEVKDRNPRKTKTVVFECLVWTSPGLQSLWTAHKEPRPGRGVSSTGLCVAEDVQPGRAEGLQSLQPPGSFPPNHRLAAHGSAALGLDTWQKQSGKEETVAPFTTLSLVYWWMLSLAF